MWVDSFKKHINDEIAYTPILKAMYAGMLDDACKDSNPEGALENFILQMNQAGVSRSRELAKFASRCLYQFREEARKLPEDAKSARLILLDRIVQQKI